MEKNIIKQIMSILGVVMKLWLSATFLTIPNYWKEKCEVKRLTQYNEELEEIDFLIDNVAERGAYTIIDLAKYRGINSDFDDFLLKIAQKLKNYEDLEEQGLLIKLPCKVGDTVYYISEGLIEPCTVEVIFLAYYTDKDGNNSYMAEIHYDREDCPYVSTEIYFTEIGKTVFLTRNEAEEALQKMNEMEG